MKNWKICEGEPTLTALLARELKIPPLLAVLLQARGVKTPEAAVEMFGTAAPISSPLLLRDMDKAVARILQAVEDFESVAVYGDYDADGVTATAILYSYLESCGADITYYIPDREGEGYGMNLAAVDTLHERGVTLIVTVDNGISSIEEVAYAATLGIDVVVTDHHRPRETLPAAVAVVDPHRADCESPCKQLSGVGVAFKLIMALEGEDGDLQSLLDNYAELVAVGTIGDIVPLTGENRTLVRAGLRLLPHTERPGLRALMELAGLDGRSVTASSVTFGLVPRINATGRMGAPCRAVSLLTSEDPEEAGRLAAEINDDNDYRRQIEAEIFEKAVAWLEAEPGRVNGRVLVVAGEGWHPGVIGIVSSRITERYGKPSLVIACADGVAKGSGRSVEGFSLFGAISSCAALLTKYGGHPMAAGLTLPTEKIDALREGLNAFAANLPGGEMPVPALAVDCALEPEELSLEIPKCVRLLEPFGQDNPPPLFALMGMRLSGIFPVSAGKHLRLTFVKGRATVTCMRFGTAVADFAYRAGDMLDLAVTLEEREYQGRKDLSIVVRELKPAEIETAALISGCGLYERALRGEALSPEEVAALLPERGDFAVLYRCLRGLGEFRGGVELLMYRLATPGLTAGRVLTALSVLAEHRLVSFTAFSGSISVAVLPAKGKTDLTDSALLRSFEKQGRGACDD